MTIESLKAHWHNLRQWPPTPLTEAVTVAVVVAVAYFVFRISDVIAIGAFRDDAVYIALGKAIAGGEGYRSVYAPGDPPHFKYPPGVPLLFALFWTIGKTLDAVVRVIGVFNIIVSAAAAGLLWHFARTRLALRPKVASVCVVGPFFLENAIIYNNLAISEPYILLGWIASLIAYYRLKEATTWPAQAAAAAGLGIVLAAALLMRTQAVVLLAAFIFAALWQRVQPRAVAIFTAVAFLPWIAWGRWHAIATAGLARSTHPDEISYLSWLASPDAPGTLIGRGATALATNTSRYWQVLVSILSDLPVLSWLLTAVFTTAFVIGLVRLGRQHPAVVATVALNVLVVLVWPFSQDRLLVAVLPFAGLAVAAAFQAARGGGGGAARDRVIAGWLLGITVISVGIRQVTLRRYVYGGGPAIEEVGYNSPGAFLATNSRFIRSVSPWVMTNTAPDDRILADRAAGLYLYTGRKAVSSLPATSFLGPPVFRGVGEFLATRILQDDVTVLIIGQLAGPMAIEIATFYERCPGVLAFTGAIEEEVTAATYRVNRDDTCIRERILLL